MNTDKTQILKISVNLCPICRGQEIVNKQAVARYPVKVMEELLQEITRRIVENFRPEKVILFGSHAWGDPGPDSDVDLLVIMETEVPYDQRAVMVRRVCRPRFLPMEILVKTPAEVGARLKQGSCFLQQILAQGRVLYDEWSSEAKGGVGMGD